MYQKKFDKRKKHRIKVLKTLSTIGDEFNNIEDTRSISDDELNDIESSDTEISVLRTEEANNVITRLLQAVSEVTNHQLLMYIRNSVRAKRRRKQLQWKAAVGIPKLESFWSSIANACTSVNDSDNTSMNDELTSLDSDNFEVEIVRDYNLISSKNLNNIIKQLENEFKSDEYSKIEKARLYTMLSYLRFVKCGRKRVEASTIVAEAAEKARNWLEAFGFEYSEVRKGMYIDRYECADVVAYHERFLERMAEYETHMIVFFAKNIEEETQLAFQDIQPLHKKGQERSVHVSEFLTDVSRRLVLCEEDKITFPNLLSEACIITYSARFPSTKALFAFDNATGYCAYSKDTLVTKNINLSPSSKQPKMRSTMYGDNIPQKMCFPEDYDDPNLCGKPKGLKQVLSERELWYDRMKLIYKGGCEEGRINCCARTTMVNQPDFRAQRKKLEEAIILAGHEVIFYPKFHCLKKTVPQALESVSLTKIRQYTQKAFRFIDIYRKGLTGKVAEYAIKKYCSHRCISDTILNEIDVVNE
ncbi:9239_t:CDS:2 [Scutellospora calospora]|uniref:9239_t:CDS:1 n=1 Tax=Scutellospora calospora TaxID=85575 RepID=A0ACA9L0P1_9GLOM|nr:9239_t:CDS:2 [Scutellospora calospora]